MNNVKKEFELYEPMGIWLKQYLTDKYKGYSIIVEDTSQVSLDKILEKHGIVDQYPQTVGLDIQIDVLGIVTKGSKSNMIFIEAKKEKLNLHHLGQLWAYCKLCDPAEAFLFSSGGMGSLNKVLVNLSREDILNFGDGKMIKKMMVAKWDIQKNAPDYSSMVPKI